MPINTRLAALERRHKAGTSARDNAAALADQKRIYDLTTNIEDVGLRRATILELHSHGKIVFTDEQRAQWAAWLADEGNLAQFRRELQAGSA